MIVDPCQDKCPSRTAGRYPSCIQGCKSRKAYLFSLQLATEHEARKAAKEEEKETEPEYGERND